ncbi:MAG: lipopolysaccharide biosynthesis protein [Anaerolineae bacterium]|nr:lipopolysaccharide biosynthesis protein [Anaerolineae bacterium]
MSTQTEQLDISKAAIRGTAWRYVAMFTGKLMVFLSTVVLARLLTKDDFGLVGYAVTVIAFLEGISDLGVTAAIIYFPDEKKRISTAFWVNQVTGLIFFIGIWFAAPAIAVFFNDERVIDISRTLALTFPLLALGYIHESVLLKRLSFKRSFIPSFLRSVAKGGASIAFAFGGFGAWSLIYGQLAGNLVASVSYWLVTPWKPEFAFDLKMSYELLKYGVVFIVGELLAITLLNLDYLLVGRYLSSEQMGVYTLAFRLPDLLILEFARTLSNVLFPIYSQVREQSADSGMARAFFLATRYISILTIPMGIGLALVAQPFIVVFFGEKWLDAVPVVQGIAVYATILSIVHNISSVYWAEGRPQILTWIGLTRLAILFPALFWAVTMTGSIVVVGWVQAVVALISALINIMVASRLIKLPIIEIARALRPAILAGTVMAGCVFGITWFLNTVVPAWLLLVISVSVGGVTYLGVLWFVEREIVDSAKDKLLSAIGRS